MCCNHVRSFMMSWHLTLHYLNTYTYISCHFYNSFFCYSVPAKIASFDDSFTTTYKEEVTLLCLAVGVPQPVITWKIKGVAFASNDRIRQQPDGSLFIRDVTRTDAGEYSCHVDNSFGQDSITHQLVVHAPPHAPQVIF